MVNDGVAPVKLGYWQLRGLGQFLRYLLEFAEADYDETRYAATKEGAAAWFGKDKESLGLDFPNLPYLIDGDTKLTQSRSIATYITKKYSLAGASGDEAQTVGMVYDAFCDLRSLFIKSVHSEDFEKNKGDLANNKVPEHLKRLEIFIGNGQWIGHTATPSYADFGLFDTLEELYELSPALAEKFPKLKSLHDRVNALPQISGYKKRSEGKKSFIDVPFFSPMAKFGDKRA